MIHYRTQYGYTTQAYDTCLIDLVPIVCRPMSDRLVQATSHSHSHGSNGKTMVIEGKVCVVPMILAKLWRRAAE
jgi:hypothetical protein